jgi:hypothetical protein
LTPHGFMVLHFYESFEIECHLFDPIWCLFWVHLRNFDQLLIIKTYLWLFLFLALNWFFHPSWFSPVRVYNFNLLTDCEYILFIQAVLLIHVSTAPLENHFHSNLPIDHLTYIFSLDSRKGDFLKSIYSVIVLAIPCELNIEIVHPLICALTWLLWLQLRLFDCELTSKVKLLHNALLTGF